jgi:hypothetical protein
VINAIKFSIEEIEASDQYFDQTRCQMNRFRFFLASCAIVVMSVPAFAQQTPGTQAPTQFPALAAMKLDSAILVVKTTEHRLFFNPIHAKNGFI